MDDRLYKVLMKCGHSANAMKQVAVDDAIPCCVICDCDEIDWNAPSLEDRKAKCIYCNNMEDSKYSLPFFKHKPNDKYDEYYCGCYGWD